MIKLDFDAAQQVRDRVYNEETDDLSKLSDEDLGTAVAFEGMRRCDLGLRKAARTMDHSEAKGLLLEDVEVEPKRLYLVKLEDQSQIEQRPEVKAHAAEQRRTSTTSTMESEPSTTPRKGVFPPSFKAIA